MLPSPSNYLFIRPPSGLCCAICENLPGNYPPADRHRCTKSGRLPGPSLSLASTLPFIHRHQSHSHLFSHSTSQFSSHIFSQFPSPPFLMSTTCPHDNYPPFLYYAMYGSTQAHKYKKAIIHLKYKKRHQYKYKSTEQRTLSHGGRPRAQHRRTPDGAKNAARRPPASPARSVPVRHTTAPAIPLQ